MTPEHMKNLYEFFKGEYRIFLNELTACFTATLVKNQISVEKSTVIPSSYGLSYRDRPILLVEVRFSLRIWNKSNP